MPPLIRLRPEARLLVLVTFVCAHCGVSSRQRVVRVRQRVVLLHLPLLPVRAAWSVRCGHCGRETPLTQQEAEHAFEWALAQRRA